ncbi:hypothetical protein Btru_031875 [Bulinus truncatus]|nr:hypothetical protein Btru_031875 [Bulinus truncatus]
MDNDKESSSKPSHLSPIIESDVNTIVMDESPKSDDEITDTSNFTETHYANLKSNAESFLDDDQEIHNVPEDGTFLDDVSINANSPAHDDDIQTNDTMENTDINEQKNKPLSKYFNETQILVKEEVDEMEGKDINNEINKRLTHVELKVADEKTKDSENMVSLITVDQHSDKRKDKVVTGVDHDSPNMDSNINMRPLTSSTIQDVPGGLRAKPNTPASQSLYAVSCGFDYCASMAVAISSPDHCASMAVALSSPDYCASMAVALSSPDYCASMAIAPSSPDYCASMAVALSSPDYCASMAIAPSSPDYCASMAVALSSPDYCASMAVAPSSPDYCASMAVAPSSPDYCASTAVAPSSPDYCASMAVAP